VDKAKATTSKRRERPVIMAVEVTKCVVALGSFAKTEEKDTVPHKNSYYVEYISRYTSTKRKF
jgi:hypothetical protein